MRLEFLDALITKFAYFLFKTGQVMVAWYVYLIMFFIFYVVGVLAWWGITALFALLVGG